MTIILTIIMIWSYVCYFLNDNNDTFETLYCKYNSRVDFYKFMPNNCIPLKCLAARVINRNFFDLKKIPVDLLTFIERH